MDNSRGGGHRRVREVTMADGTVRQVGHYVDDDGDRNFGIFAPAPSQRRSLPEYGNRDHGKRHVHEQPLRFSPSSPSKYQHATSLQLERELQRSSQDGIGSSKRKSGKQSVRSQVTYLRNAQDRSESRKPSKSRRNSETEKQVKQIQRAAQVSSTVERELHQHEMNKALEEQKEQLTKVSQKEITKLKAEHLSNVTAPGVLALVARSSTGSVRDAAYNMISTGNLFSSPLQKARARGRALGFEELEEDEPEKKKKTKRKDANTSSPEIEEKSATSSTLFRQMLLQSEL